MTRAQLESWLESKGYARDKFGHYQKTMNESLYRFKLSNISARYEKQISVHDYKDSLVHEWIRIASGYYKDLSITSAGKLVGIK